MPNQKHPHHKAVSTSSYQRYIAFTNSLLDKNERFLLKIQNKVIILDDENLTIYYRASETDALHELYLHLCDQGIMPNLEDEKDMLLSKPANDE